MADRDQDHIDLRALTWAAVGLALLLAVIGAGVAAFWTHRMPEADRDQPNAAPPPVAGAMLESAPQLDKDAYLAEKNRLLGATEWVDRRAGAARIPIDAAMAILARPPHADRGAAP
jgi:hypothetical protein